MSNKQPLVRVHRCIDGVDHQYYSSDKSEIDDLKAQLALKVDKMTLPWCINSVKRKDANNQALPPSIHIKKTRKEFPSGTISHYEKVILIIDRKSLGVYKTFSRRFGTTHTFDEAVDDVIRRGVEWWSKFDCSEKNRRISSQVVSRKGYE
ncbi:hypothetical protein VCHA53O466_50117 [Vibrio chagasii]|nr:hypothetical protein VCHA53O466_50117 [Vibrio chagasii]